jgi:hypothetical protein
MEQARIELELEKQSVLRGCGAVLHAAGSDVSKWTRAVNLDDNQRDSGLATDNEQMQTPTSSTSSSSNGGVEGYVCLFVCVSYNNNCLFPVVHKRPQHRCFVYRIGHYRIPYWKCRMIVVRRQRVHHALLIISMVMQRLMVYRDVQVLILLIVEWYGCLYILYFIYFCSHLRHRLTVLRRPPPLRHRSDRCKKTMLAVERIIRRHKYDE